MNTMKDKIEEQTPQTQEESVMNDTEQSVEQPTENEPQEQEVTETDRVAELEEKVTALEETKLRLMAEFDNYRRRTNKEKLELLDTAGERIFTEMLPLVDDMERAMEAVAKSEDVEALKEGMQLIYQKFLSFLEKNKVRPIETEDKDFSTDEHEAITTLAMGEDKKGKIIDCTQKGYKLGDKVIRFAKVVVGE